MAKKLNLKRLSVDDLSAEQLSAVDGAAAGTDTCPTLYGCFTHTTTIDCISRRVCSAACE